MIGKRWTRRIGPALALLAALTVAARADAPPAAAVTQDDVTHSIQAVWDKADAALYLRDLDGVFAAYAPGFVAVNGDEKSGVDKPRHLVQYLLAVCKSVQRTSHVETTELNDKSGSTATVTVRHDFEGKTDNPQTQQDDVIEIVSTDRDFWAKTDRGWLLQREKSLTSHTTVNGQPIVGALDTLPATPTQYNLSGVWSVQSPSAGHYIVRINQFSNRLVSTKMTGSAFVPAGFVNFYATYTGSVFPCKRQVANLGHTNASWENALVTVTDADDFTVSVVTRGPSTYQRMKP